MSFVVGKTLDAGWGRKNLIRETKQDESLVGELMSRGEPLDLVVEQERAKIIHLQPVTIR